MSRSIYVMLSIFSEAIGILANLLVC